MSAPICPQCGQEVKGPHIHELHPLIAADFLRFVEAGGDAPNATPEELDQLMQDLDKEAK